MKPENRAFFDQALDSLANVLRITQLDSKAKDGFFKALHRHSIEGFFEGMNHLSQTYRPKRKDDFPVPVVISEAIGGKVQTELKTWDCRCCGIPFTAGHFSEMKCPCKVKEYCYGCWKCELHCKCLEGMLPLEQSEPFKQCQLILGVNRPEVLDALKVSPPSRPMGVTKGERY